MKKLIIILIVLFAAQTGFGKNSYDTAYHHANYSKVFELIKSKGDSIVKENFGEEFFKSNIFFSKEESFFNCWNTLKKNWDFDWNTKDSVKIKPDYVALIYSIKFLDGFYSTIEIDLDSNGNKHVIESSDGQLKVGGYHGLIQNDTTHKFILDKKALKEIAKEQGSKFNKKTIINLRWKSNDDYDIHSNHYGYYQIELQMYSHKEKRDFPSCTKLVGVYDVLIIDPWTGRFVRKTEMTNLITTWIKVSTL